MRLPAERVGVGVCVPGARPFRKEALLSSVADLPSGIAPDAAIVPVDALDLNACDREPIHLTGAIQPHGLLLIADAATLAVVAGAGELEERLTPNWFGRRLDALIAQELPPARDGAAAALPQALQTVPGRAEAFTALLHRAGDRLIVELEPAPAQPLTAAQVLVQLDQASLGFERAGDLRSLCDRAARVFRELTGFDRVMIYRFLDDGAGLVLGEDRAETLGTFLNHHFPASDIPRQARQLYVRNRVRVIPNVAYTPAPIRPAAAAELDLSDVGLRSVSPIHLQYLRNMGVGASASISIVKDGLLWGLVACHNTTPRGLAYESRVACAALAGGLSRQIRAKEEAEMYRERIRLRAAEDGALAKFDGDTAFEDFLSDQRDELRRMLGADGFVAITGRDIVTAGACPTGEALLRLARWLGPRTVAEPFSTRSLSALLPEAADYAAHGSGVLAVTLSAEQNTLLAWFRAEDREVLEWAGNPHKDTSADPQAILTPRSSFETWREEVAARARPWTLAEVEAASRLRRQLLDVRQTRRLRELNRELGTTVAEKDALIVQKDHLLREVNHRVQNSLQLVQSFLALQARTDSGAAVAAQLGEAQRRISAVALVHRRLYQADQVETVDLARYLEELIGDMRAAMGGEWAQQLDLDLAPILISADRAVNVGLILTELVINANKYAYGGGHGPIAIALEAYRNQFRLIVADQGGGKTRAREGFGTRMMNAMVQRLAGTMEQYDNAPGLRVIVTAPVTE